MDRIAEISEKIKLLAIEQGFTACGIAPANELTDDAARLKTWLGEGMHAEMQYMKNHFNKRTDPRKLVPGAKSVIVVLLNYFPEQIQDEINNLIISKYAYGKDYHRIIKKMLKQFRDTIHTRIKPMNGRVFVDSAPVLERAWAAKAGLGWIGKNANLISPKHGSFVFIGELITDMVLLYDNSIPDYCGGCTKCVQACPTNAIVNDRIIDSRKCISYWTIEHKDRIDESLKGTFNNRIFGCDICQDICPWNRKVRASHIEGFKPSQTLLNMKRADWQQLTEEHYSELFMDSAVHRARYEGLKRNIDFVNAVPETD
jgi:epoxyqueuosine reductase